MQYAEGQKLRGSDGNIYVVRNGQPVRDVSSLPTTPLPFPSVPYVTSKKTEGERADQRLGLDYQSADRAERGLQNENIRTGIAVQNQEVRDRTAEANSGVDTTATQDRAAQHVLALDTELKILDDVRKKSPGAFRPSWKEKAVTITTDDPDFQSWAKDPQRQRATAAFRNIIESALYLKTGAAYNQEQLQGQIQALMPQMFDAPEVLADKRLRLVALLEGAKAEAGPSNVKLQEAYKRLEPELFKTMDDIYLTGETAAPPEGTGEANRKEGQPNYKLDDQYQVVEVPAEMQAEHEAFLKGKKKGQLDVGDYLAFRQKLAKKYGFTEGSIGDVGRYVNDFNSGKPVTFKLPASREKLSGFAEGAATFAKSDLGTFIGEAANAGALGIPEMLAGRGGRQALDLARKENSTAAFLGDMAGSVAPVIAIEKAMLTALGKQGITGQVASDIIANTLYGGFRGQASAEREDKEEGLIAGATSGAVGSIVGRGLAKGAAGFRNADKQAKVDRFLNKEEFETPPERTPLPVDEATPADFQALDDAGLENEIRKAQGGLDAWRVHYSTPGSTPPKLPHHTVLEKRVQRLTDHLAKDATPGKGEIPPVDLTTLQRAGRTETEEFISGFPVVHGQRQAAIESWNLQNSGRVLANVGASLPKGIKAGQEANAYVTNELSKRYNALRPAIKGRVDSGFDTAVAGLRKHTMGRGKLYKELWPQIEEAVQQFRNPDGSFDGQGYRRLTEALRGLSNDWAVGKADLSSVVERDMARVAEKVRRQAQALVSRANPAAGRELKKLEKAWAHQARINAASIGTAKANRGVYSPDEYLNKIEKLDTSKDKTAIAKGQGLDQQYAQDARDVLGSKPQKKGSVVGTAIIGAAAAAHPVSATIAAGIAAGYTPGVKRVMQAVIDGKLGKTANEVTKNLPKDSPLRTLPEDTMRAMIAQGIRAYTQQKGQ